MLQDLKSLIFYSVKFILVTAKLAKSWHNDLTDHTIETGSVAN